MIRNLHTIWACVAQPKKISFYAQKIELVCAGGSSNNNKVAKQMTLEKSQIFVVVN